MTRLRALLGFAVLAMAVAAASGCGGGGDSDTNATTAPPSVSEFPKASGSLDDLASQVTPTNDLVAAPSGVVFSPGDRRFGFGVFNVDQTQVSDADIAIYAAHYSNGKQDGKTIGPLPATDETLATEPAYVAKTTADDPDSAKSVYVVDIPFDEPGEYRMIAVIKQDGDLLATALPSTVVKDQPDIPAVGDEAPSIHTPTVEEVGGDIASIDTRVPPDSMHDTDLADVIGKKPVVLLFATPALCQSRVCGPVVDVEEQVKDEYGDKVAFIHNEIYEDNQPPKLRSQVRAYGLQTEPWLFVIDADGKVSTRIEGAFSVNELEDAVAKVAGPA